MNIRSSLEFRITFIVVSSKIKRDMTNANLQNELPQRLSNQTIGIGQLDVIKKPKLYKFKLPTPERKKP